MEQIGLSAVVDLSQFDSGISRYIARTKEAETATTQAAGSLGKGWDSMGKSVLGATEIMGKALVGATAAAAAAVGAFVVNGIKGAADLQAQLSTVASVLGVTTAEVGPLKEAVYGLALNPNLKVSVDEAASAMEMLARNGLSMEEILGGAAEATVLLANATKADFSTAADIATDSMAIFGIEAENMMSAVDGIVSVTNNSKFGIEDYGFALAQAGAVAAGAGVEFEDFNTSIAATSSNFARGGDAGTSFKTFLQTLIPKSKEATGVMQELGLMTADGANQFYDANGNLKDMNDIAVLLQGALAGLSEEQRNTALNTLFGADASRTALGLMDAGKVVYTDLAQASRELGISQDELRGYIEGGITAFEVQQAKMRQTDALQNAKTNTDNFSSAMSMLADTIDAIGRQVGDLFLPMLQELALKLNDIAGQMGPGIISAFEKVLVVIEDFQAGVFGYDYDWSKVFPPTLANIATGVSKTIEFVANNFGALAGAIGGVAVVLAASGIQAAIVAIGAALAAVNLPLLAVVAGAALLGAAWGSNFLGIRDITLQVGRVIGDTLSDMAEWFGTYSSYVQTVWAATGAVLTTTAGFIAAGIRAAFGEETDWRERGAGIMDGIRNGITATQSTLITVAQNVGQFIQNVFNDIDWPAVGQAILTGIGKGIGLMVGALLFQVGLVVEGIKALWAVDWQAVGTAILEGIRAGVQAMTGALTVTMTGVVSVAKALWDLDWAGIGQTILDGIIAGVNLVAPGALERVGAIAADALAKFTSINWKQTGQDILDAIGAGVEAVKAALLTKVKAVAQSLYDAFTNIDWSEIGQAILDGIGAGIERAKQALKDKITELADAMPDWLKDLWGINSPAKVFIPLGESVVEGLIVGIDRRTGDLQAAMGRLAGSLTGVNFARGPLDDALAGFKEYAGIVGNLVDLGADGSLLSGFLDSQTKELEARQKILKVFESLRIDPYSIFAGDFLTVPINELLQGLQDASNRTVASVRTALETESWRLSRSIKLDPLMKALEEQGRRLKLVANTTFTGFFDTAATELNQSLARLDNQITGAREFFILTGTPQAEAQLADLIAQRAKVIAQLAKVSQQQTAVLGVSGDRTALNQALQDQLALVQAAREAGLSLAGVTPLTGLDTQQLINLGVLQNAVATKQTDALRKQVAEALYLSTLPTDLSVGGDGSAIADRFRSSVLDPILRNLRESVLLEDRRTALMAQYRQEAAKVLALQEKQNQLDFLKEQLDLLTRVKEAGLDPAQIFQGLQFGVNASVSDLLAATTRAVQAMIAQVQSQLQIASPSKVFVDIGKQVMAGLAKGIDSNVMRPLSSFQRAIEVPRGSVSNRSLVYTNNNYISSGVDAASLETRILRTVEYALSN